MTPPHDSDQGADSGLAPQHVQDEISALLRGAAADDDASATMPANVEARLRAAMAAEFGAPTGRHDTQGPPKRLTVVPLPGQRSAPERDQRAAQEPAPLAGAPLPAHSPTASAVPPQDNSSPSTSSRGSATAVPSLDEHRRRRGRTGKVALALGAAAAVAIGAITVTQNHSSGPQQAAEPHGETSSSGADQTYASRVRVTQTETRYTKQDLSTEAAALRTSTSPSIEPVQANSTALGPLATATGVRECLKAVGPDLADNPDKVYADFATYDGTPAVIVVTTKGGKSTAWVVSRSCRKASDLKAGPTPLHT